MVETRITTAPEAYDYGSSVESSEPLYYSFHRMHVDAIRDGVPADKFREMSTWGKMYRRITFYEGLDDYYIKYQGMRYQSGMYMAWSEAEWLDMTSNYPALL